MHDVIDWIHSGHKYQQYALLTKRVDVPELNIVNVLFAQYSTNFSVVVIKPFKNERWIIKYYLLPHRACE